MQLVDAGDPGHGGDQLGLDSGQQSEGRRDGTELQTKVPEDYAKFHNHGEVPYFDPTVSRHKIGTLTHLS